MHIVRLVGFVVAACAAVAVFVFMAPDGVERIATPTVEGLQPMIDQAIADYDQNSLAAGDDPQLQIVSNGWVARDLLFIVATEMQLLIEQVSVLSAQTNALAADSEPDDRVPALLMIGVVTFGFHAATLPASWEALRGAPAAPTSTADEAAEQS